MLLHGMEDFMLSIYSLMQFVLALGNRPKGEKTAYLVTITWVFLASSLLHIC